MPGTLNVADDFDEFDFVEPVTYRKLNADGLSFTNTANVNALGMKEHHDYRGVGEARLSVIARTWHLKAGDMAGIEVEHGDRILDAAGTEWIVDAGAWEVWQTTWRCETWRKRNG
jgi:hypothetical protein